MSASETTRPPILSILEGASSFIEQAINGWAESGRPLEALAIVIQWLPDGKGRVAPVDRDRFAAMIEPSSEIREKHPNEPNVIVANQIASLLRHRLEGYTPAVLNFDAEDGAVSRVVLLRFVGGILDVRHGTAGVA